MLNYNAKRKSRKPREFNKKFDYSYQQLKNYCFNRLYNREYSRRELSDKMQKLTENKELINQALDEMVINNYLSDERRARAVIRAYKNKEGRGKINFKLKDLGIDKFLVEEIWQFFDEEDAKITNYDDNENNVCLNLLIKKFKFYDVDTRDKMTRHLASRGFSFDDIKKAINLFKKLECEKQF